MSLAILILFFFRKLCIFELYLTQTFIMTTVLKLNQIFIGSVDAKHELLTETIEEKNQFLTSFLTPDNFNIEDYTKKNKYFVTGLKGTGKTAFLRYLSLKMENKNSQTHFILFKTDFKEEDRKELHKTGKSTIADIDKDSSDDDDYTNTWLWFLYKQILYKIENTKVRIVAEDENFQKFKTCLTSFEEKVDDGSIKKVFPKLKNGSFEIKLGFKNTYGKGHVDFEWVDKEQKIVKFSSLVSITKELFKKLKKSNFPEDTLTFFVDELELSFGKSKQYNRDVRLIRDLIIAIYEINLTAKKNGISLKIIGALRSEVLSVAAATGKEINKIVTDFGMPINWHQSGGDIKKHPLLKIIYRRIITSETTNGLTEDHEYEAIWSKYFPAHIQGKPPHDYILHATWYRPRDIIRLLSLGQKMFPNELGFTQQLFDGIKKEYSADCWAEHAEELKAKFTSTQIDGIRLMLTGIKSPFTFNQVNEYAEHRKELYNEVDDLLKNHKMASILNILFQIGIIGNAYPKFRFAFRGDQDLLIDKSIKIHDALYNFLAIE